VNFYCSFSASYCNW